ncbi:MAG: hypothetical protein LBR22_03135, partial [Desulfovibrio sp.]|nr:hypothetical protein [Desulfovibrio sp.]
YRHPAQQHHKEVRANRAKCTKGLRPHDKVEVDGRTCFLTTVKANGTCAFEDILGNMLTNANGNRREVTYRKVRRIQAATSVMREWVEAWGNF